MSEENDSPVKTFFKTFSVKKFPDKDLEQFGKRISTYIVGQKWVFRPLALSPAVCAQYGWICVNTNLLECVTCNAKLCTSEANIEIYDAYVACILKTLTDLKGGHKANCPWPISPVPDSFVRMLPMPKEEALQLFQLRLKTFLEFRHSVPQVTEDTPSKLGLNETQMKSLGKSGGLTDEESQLFGRPAVCMAATGWSLISQGEEQKISAYCVSCQRTVWVGMFNVIDVSVHAENEKESSLNGDNHSREESPSPPRKRLKKENFNPLSEHRMWCLWLCSDVLRNSGMDDDLSNKDPSPGHKIFLTSLLRNVLESEDPNSEQAPSRENLRTARSLLESWTSPV